MVSDVCPAVGVESGDGTLVWTRRYVVCGHAAAMPSASRPTVFVIAVGDPTEGDAPETTGVDAPGTGEVATGGAVAGTGVGSSSSSTPQAANARVARRTTTSEI